MTRIVVRVSLKPIAEDLHGDYVNDKGFKQRFQQWLMRCGMRKTRC